MTIPDLIRKLYHRLQEAERLVAEGRVEPLPGFSNRWLVWGEHRAYIVDLTQPDRVCECPDATYRPELRGLCKHRLAVELFRTNGQILPEGGEEVNECQTEW